ncbi:MAG: FkbM family methyltransferase [Candidatus Competibacteraceae bacterium]|nr:FkbM family methyltransferase [Candidatus Competibacteraceae bacterium]
MPYSQNNEEEFIVSRLGSSPGRFLDIGAYDGKVFSNTLRLAELGWSGVCYEPSPSVFPALKKLYENNPTIICVQQAVASATGTLTFFDSNGDAISSLSVAHKQKWEAGWKCSFTQVEVEAVAMGDVFAKYGYDFEFINLDVEGANIDLFNLIPFERLTRLKMFCVEHDGHASLIEKKLAPFGFEKVCHNPENLIVYRPLSTTSGIGSEVWDSTI